MHAEWYPEPESLHGPERNRAWDASSCCKDAVVCVPFVREGVDEWATSDK